MKDKDRIKQLEQENRELREALKNGNKMYYKVRTEDKQLWAGTFDKEVKAQECLKECLTDGNKWVIEEITTMGKHINFIKPF